ncbi:MAG: 4-hydroxybenzoate octaprenyltransferase [Methylotenera sp.]|uniref:4-hydroxybenzoate octaprenyltransferase n=1 Tax=Methylotenera sp. TaxID=2051956 RepID=UPI002720D075|nr:4-hydroxybenzoate octaprenyltransferase [Methylotenera sp.]MDO9151239.1 4-hydroxybenzoate octaprenyltransferase [Methylotenera sp.]
MNTQDIVKKINSYERLMRLDKPIGILLLLWPTLWALLIAGTGKPDWIIVLIFITGTVLMRSAGCVMNDIADSQYDGLVERTKNRPLPNKEVTKKEAYCLALGLSVVAFGLVCVLNTLTIQLSLLALFLALTYPLTKRFFAIPQAYLGIAFGFGIPMAFAAIDNHVPAVAWMLLLANVFWTIAYDTEYAMVDREDDLKIGIKSSAITFGGFDVVAIMLCYGMTLLLLGIVGYQLKLSFAYYTGLVGAGFVAVYHFYLIRGRLRAKCFQAFLGNNWFGFFVFSGILVNYLIKAT